MSVGDSGLDGVPASVRAQLLATEHWSLLATRSQTWSEVIGRIAVYLTLVSASVVSLALVAQASGFGTEFRLMALTLSAVILLLGTLTYLRVHNASTDDMNLVIGTNRLRAAYAAMAPGLEEYFVASHHDDQAGVMQTYGMGVRRGIGQPLASATMFVAVVNGIVAGALGALVAEAVGAEVALVAVAGAVVGLTDLTLTVSLSARHYLRAMASYQPHFPSPVSASV